jgi:hypothetical protein
MKIDTSPFPESLIDQCKNTFTLFHKEEVTEPSSDLQAFPTFNTLLADCISFMIQNCRKSNYVQCAAIEYKDYALKHQTLNFCMTILEKSHFVHLFEFLKQKDLYFILCNYTIILQYQNDFIQVAGRPLNLDFNTMLN